MSTKFTKKALSIILAIAMCLSLFAVPAAANAADVIEIGTFEELAAFRDAVDSGTNYSGVIIQLTADIDLGGSAAPWTPIGTFAGTFDGCGFTVSGMYISANLPNVGFIGFLSGGTVKNLTVAGEVYALATTTGNTGRGGIVGFNNGGTIDSCRNDATVMSTSTSTHYLGGIVGTNAGTVINCVNTGDIFVTGAANAGIAGRITSGSISYCYNTGNVTGTGTANNHIGGIVGQRQSGTIANCYTTGAVVATANSPANIGAAIGTGSGTNIYSLGGVTAAGSGTNGTVKTADEMKTPSFLDELNNGTPNFVRDAENLNDGFPILAWQSTGTETGVDKTELDALITNAEARAEADYTAASWSAFQSALADAKSTVNDDGAAQDAVNAAVAALQAAINALVDFDLDRKSELNALITFAEALNASGYTVSSWNAFASVLAAVKSVSADYGATTEEIADALDELQAAIDALVAAADKSALNTLIAKADALNEEAYTPETWSPLQTVLAAAKTVAADGDAAQEAVGAAAASLQSAMDALVDLDLIKKAELNALIVETEKLIESDYTVASWGTVASALTAATAVSANRNAANVEIEAAVAALQAAIDALVFRTPDLIISTAAEFAAFRDKVNSGTLYAGQLVQLAADIDLSAYESWTMIGTNTSRFFKGIFDGNGHVIKNLNIPAPKTGQSAVTYAGMFKYAGDGAVIKNLGIESGSIGATTFVGAIVGEFRGGEMINCWNAADVTSVNTVASGRAGGLIGQVANGYTVEITNCYNIGNITAGHSGAGGILGSVDNGSFVIESCYNAGTIKAKNYAGGIVGDVNQYGYRSISIVNSFNAGILDTDKAGGIVGKTIHGMAFETSVLDIINCYYRTAVFVQTVGDTDTDPHVANATAVSREYMISPDFAVALGDAFVYLPNGEYYPSFPWQAAGIYAEPDGMDEPGDKTELFAVIESVKNLHETDYTTASWSAFQSALATAQAVAGNEDATQREIDLTAKALLDAKNALTRLGVKTNLAAKIAEAEALSEADYTAESWTAFTAALTTARTVAANAEATQPQVDTALAALTAALNSLKELDRIEEPWETQLNASLAYLLKTVPSPGFGTISGEWTVFTLARAEYPVPDGYFDAYYDKVVNTIKGTWVDENSGGAVTKGLDDKVGTTEEGRIHDSKATENERLILALSAIGKVSDDFGGHDVLWALADMSYLRKQGINGSIFGLLALDTGKYPVPENSKVTQANLMTRDKLITELLNQRLASGGWALSGTASDPDITAMCIQSLAPYYNERQDVTTAIEGALNALSALQRNEGDFASWGTVNVESTAQVLVALTALGIDPMTDSRFIKGEKTLIDGIMKYAVAGGGFKHISGGAVNSMATDQATYALVAYWRFTQGKTPLYNMTDVSGNGYANKGSLKTEITAAEALTEADYTPASWNTLVSALSNARTAVAKTNATQAEIDGVLTALANAVLALDDADSGVAKGELRVKIAEAVVLAEADYTAGSWNLFSPVLGNAKTIEANGSATQSEIDSALAALTDAINALVSVKDLKAKIAAADALKNVDYTAGSWAALSAPLADAKTVAAKTDAAQTEVDASLAALTAVMDKLVNISALKEKIADAEKLDAGKYTAQSWKTLSDALTAAKTVAAKTDATKDEADKALNTLNTAINSLVTNSNPGGGGGDDDSDLKAHKDKALAELDKQFAKYSQGDYTTDNWSKLVAAYNAGKAAINAAEAADPPFIENNVVAVLNKALQDMSNITPSRVGDITIAVSMDANTIGLGYLIKPTLVTVPKNERASQVITDLLRENGYSWTKTGTVENSFYLATVSTVNQTNVQIAPFILAAIGSESEIDYSDRNRTWLGEFSYYRMSGWMYSVSDGSSYPTFPGIGSTDWHMSQGEVMRWQFTVFGYGADLNADNASWGSTSIVPNLGDKTALTWAVAELRAQYDDTTLEKNADYNAVLKTLTDPQATQSVVDAALVKLNGISFGSNPGGGGGNGEVPAGGSTTVEDGSAVTIIDEIIPLSGDPTVVVIDIETDGQDVNSVTAEITAENLNNIAENGSSIEMRSVLGDVRLPNEAIKSLTQNTDEKLGIVLSQTGTNAYSVKIVVDGNTVGTVAGGIVAVIPNAGGAGTVAVLVKADGTEEIIKWSVLLDGKMQIPLGGTDNFKIIDNTKSFADVQSGAWYEDAVTFAAARELMQGTGTDTFSPGAYMTRAMLVTLLYRLDGNPAVSAANGFADVDDGMWYTDAIIWANENGIVNGYGNGSFGTNDNVTREQIALILMRYAEMKSFGTSRAADITAYTDESDISDWAKQAFAWANAEGIITGRTETTLAPKGTATRAEVATVIRRFIEDYSK